MTKQPQTAIDKKFMTVAEEVMKNSDDPHVKLGLSKGVGCVIIKENKIIGKSANILPPNLSSNKMKIKPYTEGRYQYIEHAERSAIFSALMSGHNTTNSTLYCTRFPCSDCARAIIAVGIIRVVVKSGFGKEPKNTAPHIRPWKDSQRAALAMLRAAKIKVRYLN